MDDSLAPPAGLTTRPLSFDDIDAVVALANACELHDVGFTMWEREDLTSDFRIDGVDPSVDTVGVAQDDRLIGWAFLPHDRSAWADVHPDARGRGIGTWLRRWTEDRAGQRGSDRIGQTINDRAEDAAALFVAAGYTPRRASWILSMQHDERPADPAIPDGIVLRSYRPGDDEEVLGMFEDAFAEAPDRVPSTLSTWRSMTIEREGFAPEDLVLAVDGQEIVGGAFLIDSDEIWVDKLAVRRDHRDRGIARALLQIAFQRGFDRGYAATSLSTDSDRSALAFYEKVGMRVRESYTHHATDLH
jgi:mycothiol synthase